MLRGEPLVPLSDVTFADEAGRPGSGLHGRRAAGPRDAAGAQAGGGDAGPRASAARTPDGGATIAAMPEIDFAFLADAAETQPGHKFNVLGGGITRIGGRTFPLRHPHLALVVGLRGDVARDGA